MAKLLELTMPRLPRCHGEPSNPRQLSVAGCIRLRSAANLSLEKIGACAEHAEIDQDAGASGVGLSKL
jgi:hypothetical protein